YMDVAPTAAANGRTVLLMHGRNFPASYWEPTVKTLAGAGYRVIAPDQINFGSGRIEARTGLRMMPTFPRSPRSFRTAGFVQYGCKAGFPSGAFRGRLIGAKPPPRPKHGWSIRTKLQVEERIRDLALFNVAIDSKLRG